MNPYLNYHIAQDRHNEFLRQAKKNQHFDRQIRLTARQVGHRVLTMLNTPTRIIRKALRGARPQVDGHIDLQERLS